MQTSQLADSARRIRHVKWCNTSRTNGIAEILWNNPNNNGVGQTSEVFLVVFGANSLTIKWKLIWARLYKISS